MNSTIRYALIGTMLLATTALAAIAYKAMQPEPKEEVVFKPSPPSPPPPANCNYTALPPSRQEVYLLNCTGLTGVHVTQLLAYRDLLARAERFYPTNAAEQWKLIYAELEKEPTRYVYWNLMP